uniref:Hemolysin-type calcium-binding region n=1 Tax=Magnetococcus massalia (strain MO-1) TaxID=451514 RepID=A0A1S7LMZ9_MAGMO
MDGSESINAVTITGIPDGAELQLEDGTSINVSGDSAEIPMSAITSTGESSYTIAGLEVKAPADSNENFTLGVDITTTDSNGETTVSTLDSGSISVEVASVADGSEVVANDVTANEDDASVALDIGATLLDTDGSESIASVIIEGVPDTVQLSAGTDNNDGTWTLAASDLEGLTATVDPNASGTFEMKVIANTVDSDGDSGGDDTISNEGSFTLTVTPDADEVTFTAGSAAGDEDSWIDVNSSFSLQDLDGSENVTAVTLNDIPSGAELQVDGSAIAINNGSATIATSHLSEDGNGNYQIDGLQIKAPADSNVDFDLGIDVTVTDTADGMSSTQVTGGTIGVTVTGVVDEINFAANATGGTEDQTITLDLSGGLTDTDGSESFTVELTGVPDGASLSAGTDNGGGSWTITSTVDSPVDLSSVELSGLADNYSGSFDLGATWTVTDYAEDGSGGYTTTVDDTATGSVNFTVTVDAVADQVDISTGSASGDEDSWISIDSPSFELQDTDGGNEAVSAVTLSGIPDGAELRIADASEPGGYYSVTVTGGEADIPLEYLAESGGSYEIEGLEIQAPDDSNVNFAFGVHVTTTDDSSSATTDSSVDVTVASVADDPNLTAGNVSGDEGTTINLDIASTLNDTDDSEEITHVEISGVPSGVTLSDGTTDGSGTWTVDVADLPTLQAEVGSDFSGVFDLSVTSYVTDTDSDAGGDDSVTEADSFKLTINPEADGVTITDGSASGAEDSWIAVNEPTFQLNDSDGSESIHSVTLTDLPSGAELQLSGGTAISVNGSGEATIPSSAIVGTGTDGEYTIQGLEVKAPEDSNVNFTMGVSVVTIDDNGTTTDLSSADVGSIAVTVSSVADAPDVTANDVTAAEDTTTVTLDLSSAVTDSDGSESITGVTISGVPSGVTLSEGSDQGGGVWALEIGDLAGLEANIPENLNGTFDMTVTATVLDTDLDAGGNDTTTGSDTFTLTLTADVDGVTIVDGSASGLEDQWISVTEPTFTLSDSAGEEISAVTISGIPDGTELKLEDGTTLTVTDGEATIPSSAIVTTGTDGQYTIDGLMVKAPEDSNVDFDLSVNVTTADGEGALATTATDTGTISVTVTGVADDPNFSATDATGTEDQAITLNLAGELGDTDGSETLVVTITGVPDGANLSAGTDQGGGTWVITSTADAPVDLSAVQLTDLADDYSGQFNLGASWSLTDYQEDGAGGFTTTVDDSLSGSTTFSVTVDPDADEVSVTASAAGAEDQWIDITSQFTVGDTDGSESIGSVTFSDIPDGASLQLSDGTAITVTDGVATIPASAIVDNSNGTFDVTGLQIQAPEHSNVDMDLSLNVTVVDDNGITQDTVTSSHTVTVDVEGIADGVDNLGVAQSTVEIEEDKSFYLHDSNSGPGLSSDLIDTDGSEKIFYKISVESDDGNDSAWLQVKVDGDWETQSQTDDVWTISGEDVDAGNVRMGAGSHADEDFTVNVDAYTVDIDETDGGIDDTSAIASTSFSVDVDSNADEANIWIKASGTEDQSITIQNSIQLYDADGSESLDGPIIITMDPDQGSLSIVEAGNEGLITETATAGVYEVDQAALTATKFGTDDNGDSYAYKWSIAGLTLDPAENSADNVSLNFLTKQVEETDDGNGKATEYTSKDYTVAVKADVDGATLDTPDAIGLEDSAIALDPTIALGADQDGSETVYGDVVITSTEPGAVGAEMVLDGFAIKSSTTKSVSKEMVDGELVTNVDYTTTWKVPADRLTAETNGDGDTTGWSFDNLTITPPDDSDADFDLEFALTIKDDDVDSGGDSYSSTISASMNVQVDAVADAPDLDVRSSRGQEDSDINLNIELTLNDTDGSETTYVTISDVPTGAVISAGTQLDANTWQVDAEDLTDLTIRPPAESNEEMNLTVTATSVESNPTTGADNASDGGEVDTAFATTASQTFTVRVLGVADEVEMEGLTASGVEDAPLAGAPDGAIQLDLTGITLGDDDFDNSEQLSVVISNIPDGVKLWASEDNPDALSYMGGGKWGVNVDNLDDVHVIPVGDFGGEFSMDVTAVSTERSFKVDDDGNFILEDGEKVIATGGDQSISVEQLTVTVEPDADQANINITATGYEDAEGGIDLNISPSVTDTDGSESVNSITVSGIPGDVELYKDGVLQVADGSGNYQFDPDDIDALTLVTPLHSNEDFTIDVSAETIDSNGDTATRTESHNVDVIGVADGVENLVAGQQEDPTSLVLEIAKGTNSPHAGGFEIVVVDDDGNSQTFGPYQTDLFHNNGNDSWESLEINDIDFSNIDPNNITFQGTSNQSNILIKGVTIAGNSFDPTEGSGDFSVNGDSNGDDYVRMSGNGKECTLDTSSTDFDDLPISNTVTTDGVHQIPLEIQSDMIDLDGSESRYYIVENVPNGAFLAAGVDGDGDIVHTAINAGDGMWIVQEGDLADLHLVPQEGLADEATFSIGVRAVTVENDGDIDYSNPVTVTFTVDTDLDQSSNPGPGNGHPNSDVGDGGVAVDGVTLTSGGQGDEDSAINMGINSTQLDNDGSEVTTFVIADDDLPPGADLSAGLYNPLNSTWVFTSDEIADLNITPPENFSGEMNIDMEAFTVEVNGDEMVQPHTVTVDVDAVTDGPNISISSASGLEDSTIDLDVAINLPDSDGSESLTGAVIVTGVPAGAVLALDGIQINSSVNGDGDTVWEIPQADLASSGGSSWTIPGLTITPATDDSDNFDLTISVTGGEGGAGDAADVTVSSTVNVDVQADADEVILTVQDQVDSGIEDNAFALQGLSATLDGTGSETVNIVITGHPEGTVFSHGFNNGDGTWSVSPDDLGNLELVPPNDFSGSMSLQLNAYALDRDGDTGDIDIQHNSSAEFTVSFEADADLFNVSTENAEGIENSPIALNLSASSMDNYDGASEGMVITLDGFPAGSELSAGTSTDGGETWTLTGDQLNGLNFTPPTDYNGELDITMTLESDQNNVEVVSKSFDFTISVDDRPTVTMDEPSTLEAIDDGVVDIGSHISLSDTDSTNMTGATVAIASGAEAGDSFSLEGFTTSSFTIDGVETTFIDGTNIEVTGGGIVGDGDLVLSGTDSLKNYEEVLQAVKLNVDEEGTRDIEVTVTDEEGGVSEIGSFQAEITEGTDGADNITGTAGDDTYVMTDGADNINAGAGDDLFIFGMNEGSDFISGGAGYTDVIRMDGMTDDPTINLDAVDNWTIETDASYSIESNVNIDGNLFDQLTFDDGDAAGTITLEDGSELQFDGVDQIVW